MTSDPYEFESKILEEAVQSPVAALMRLSLEIDRQLRLILAVIGRLSSYTGLNPSDAIELLSKSTEVPSELHTTMKNFWQIRNAIVHGEATGGALALRALDYGLRILKMLAAIPRPTYRVKVANIPLFADQEAKWPRSGVSGVQVQTFAPDGTYQQVHIFPTTREYWPGQSVTWEWRNELGERGWEETWYRDPETGEIKFAWSGSIEFVGRNLATV